MIISDSSPLILLAKIGRLELIEKLYTKIVIPYAVYHEVIIRGKEERYNDAFLIEQYINRVIIVNELTEEQKLNTKKFNFLLGAGESEAIYMAMLSKTNLLLIDNYEPRKIAESQQIKCRSTLGILYEGLTTKILSKDEYIELVKKLAEHAWLSGDIVAYFIDLGYRFRGDSK